MAESKDYRQILTDKLIAQLEEGTAPWQKPWDAKAGIPRLPYNPTTGKEYRGANSLMLSMYGRSDPRWCTYKQADAQGWQVRKGEKGALVEYWKFYDERPAVDDKGRPILDEKGEQKTITVQLEKPQVFRAVVFNAQQMDNVPELAKGPRQYEWDPLERAEQIMVSSQAKIFHDQNDRAFYSPARDEIHMPGRDQFPSAQAYYSTSLHELGHWTGHESRLGRDLTGGFGSSDYAKEELRAELASYFLADKLGIPHEAGGLDQHAAYVKSWIKALKDDKNEIFRAARDAEQMTEYVLQLDRDRSKEMGREQGMPSPDLAAENVELAEALRGARERGGGRAFLDGATEKMLGVTLPEQWTGSVQVVGVVERQIDGQRHVMPAVDDAPGTQPEFYGVYAQLADGRHEWLADRPDLGKAKAFADRLVDIHQLSQPDIEPGRTPEVTVIVPPPPEKELAKERTPLVVSYREKEAAKALGAKWDKDAKGWYAPEGTDLKPLAKWLPKGPEQGQALPAPAAAEKVPTEKSAEVLQAPPAQEKTWLAVPFTEKHLAREAGAKWDKDAKAWYAPPGVDQTALAKWVPKQDLGQSKALDPLEEFAKAIRAAGLEITDKQGKPLPFPEMDGELHRVPLANGKKGNRDGAYVGYLDGRPAGIIHNWSTGERQNWKLEGPEMSAEERARLAAQAAVNKQLRAEKLAGEHDAAASKAKARWNRATELAPGEQTPYLARKQVEGYGLRREGSDTLVPVRDIDGKLWAVQTVFPEKKELVPGTEPLDKVFTKESKKEGHFHMIGEVRPGEPIITVEGYATGASVHMATGYAVAVSFDSGNLEPVVGALKERYPTNPHFVGADDDRFAKPGRQHVNAGLTKAIEAASKHDVGVIVPAFAEASRGTDFNDMHVEQGIGAVTAVVDQAISQTMARSREQAGELARQRLGPDAAVTSPGPNTRHTGEVVGVNGYHATQVAGKAAVVHQVKDLDQLPKAGQVATIQYRDGKGKVADKAQDKTKEKQTQLQR